MRSAFLVRSRGGLWFAVMDLDQIATYVRETLSEPLAAARHAAEHPNDRNPT